MRTRFPLAKLDVSAEARQDRLRPVRQETIVVGLQVAQQSHQQLQARVRLAGDHAQGGGQARKLFGHARVVHVDADAHDHETHAIGLRMHFREDAAEFLSGHQQVVGPAQVRSKASFFEHGIAHRQTREQRDERRDQRRDRRPQQDRNVDAAGLFGMPGAPGATASGGLFLGQNDGAVRLARAAEVEGDGVGRAGLEEMMDMLAEDGTVQPAAQQASATARRARVRSDSPCADGPSRARRVRAAARSIATRPSATRRFPGRSSDR